MVRRVAAYLSGRSTLIRRLLWALPACAVLADFFVPRPAAHFWGDALPGFWALFGLGGSLALLVVSKALAGRLRMPDEEEGGDGDG